MFDSNNVLTNIPDPFHVGKSFMVILVDSNLYVNNNRENNIINNFFVNIMPGQSVFKAYIK